MRTRRRSLWLVLSILLAAGMCHAGSEAGYPESPAPEGSCCLARTGPSGADAGSPQTPSSFDEATAPAAGAPLRLTVLFFNDLHGHLLPFTVKQDDGTRVEVGGIARIATLIRAIRTRNEAQGARTLVLVAGDILQGTPMSTVFHGEPDVESLNAIGVDAMVVGNHEFDFGLENFQALRKRAQFPFISANLMWKDSGRPVCDAYAAFTLTDRIRVTVVGATTAQLLTSTRPENVVLLEVIDPMRIVREVYESSLGKGPVILLSHSKAQADEAMAAALPGLVAVIGGHDQVLLNPCKEVGGVHIFQAFEKGRYLGRFDLIIDPRSGKAAVASWTYVPITADIRPDPEVDRLVEAYHARLDKQFKEVIGECMVFMDGERERIRYEETNLGDFVTDIMRGSTGAEIALLNAGSLRASLDEGPITLEEVFKAMPYENELVTVRLTGEEIAELLGRAVRSTRAEEDGGFLHVSGICFRIRDRVPCDIRVGPKPLDPAATYTVAITDFMASGGDGYELLARKPSTRTGSPLRELIGDTIRRQGKVTAAKEGRILREGP
ncbi:MAG: 5'-nucleotidase C-terminal domain-containing protein [bacterium]